MQTAVRPGTVERLRPGSPAVLLAVVLGCVVSVGLFLIARSWEWRWIEQQFLELAQDRALVLEREFSHCASQVQQVSGYFAGSEYVTRAEFRTYVSRMSQGMGDGWLLQWVPYVRGPERAVYEGRARAEGYREFAFNDLDAAGQLAPAAERSEYLPIYYQYPRGHDRMAIGLDLATDPRKQLLFQKAVETGEIVVSPRVSHQLRGSTYAAFLVIAPVFRAGSASDDDASRKEDLLGLVVGVLRIEDFLNRALRYSGPRGVIVRVEDLQEEGDDRSCWQYEGRSGAVQEVALPVLDNKYGKSLSRSQTIQMGDQQWRVICLGTPAYEAAHRSINQWILLVLGLAMTGVVANHFRKTNDYTRGLMEANQRLVLEVGEREKIAGSLKESERFLSLLLANVPGMVYRCRNDHDWTMVFVSDGCVNLTGYPRTDLLQNGRLSFAELVHPDDRMDVWDSVQKALAERTEFELRYRIQTAAGDEKWVWERGRGVFLADGGLAFLEGFITDITDQKLAEKELALYRDDLEARVAERTQQLEESRARLRRSERLASIGTLAAGIAHEINNPVGTILLAAENALELRKRPGSEAVVDDCLKGIVSEARRCGAVIQSVLQFARQERTAKCLASIDTIVSKAVDVVASYAREKEAAIDFAMTAGLPDVMCNRLQLEQVFVNLLRNAMESGGKGLRILVQAQIVEQKLRVMVGDNGPGIPEEDLPRIFDPFFTTRRERGGTGLGLSITHGIILEHGGQIAVRSEPGVGTTFTIDLPVGESEKPEVPDGQGADR